MYRIIALDPGGTTGYAVLTVGHGNAMNWRQGHLGPDEHHKALWALLELQAVSQTAIVCESFEYRNNSRAGLVLVSAEYIGITKLFARERNIPLFFQTAAEGKCGDKTFVRKEHLERLGLWKGTKWKHAMDATAHLVRWIVLESKKHPEVGVDEELREWFVLQGWKR
jgi:hypothetical protein